MLTSTSAFEGHVRALRGGTLTWPNSWLRNARMRYGNNHRLRCYEGEDFIQANSELSIAHRLLPTDAYKEQAAKMPPVFP